MGTIAAFVGRGKESLRFAYDTPWVRKCAELTLYTLTGAVLSAGGLAGFFLTLVPGLLVTLRGLPAVCVSLGGLLGYRAFWGNQPQAVCWILLAMATGMLLSGREKVSATPLFLPAMAALVVSASGVAFQVFFQDKTTVLSYFLRVLLAAGTAGLAQETAKGRNTVTDVLVGFLAALSLSQIWIGDLSLGLVCAGFLGASASFPGVILGGAALDFAGVGNVPMTAVMCVSFLPRFLPQRYRYFRCFGSALGYLWVSGLLQRFSLIPGVSLLLGGGLALLVPLETPVPKRLGTTGRAQVQLELAAEVLHRSKELMGRINPPPVDKRAILDETVTRACGNCPNRKTCGQTLSLPEELLTAEYPHPEDISCRKPNRVLQELRYSQNTYRVLLGDNRRRKSYMEAVGQQYAFLEGFLRDLSDRLPERHTPSPRYHPEVAVCSAGQQSVNGDAGLWFGGTGEKFYLLLCDGMGTGALAAQESRESVAMLKGLLRSGYPIAAAMGSLNSLCYLRGSAGVVTADVTEVALNSGKASFYKWGACETFLVRSGEVTAFGGSPVPVGIAPGEKPENVGSVHLRSGDVIVMVSDGVAAIPPLPKDTWEESPGEIAAIILSSRDKSLRDDATVLVMRLNRV